MLTVTPPIARAVRAYLMFTHKELAIAAGVSTRTVFKLEKDGLVTTASLDRVMAVFERYGIELVYDRQGTAIGFTCKNAAGP